MPSGPRDTPNCFMRARVLPQLYSVVVNQVGHLSRVYAPHFTSRFEPSRADRSKGVQQPTNTVFWHRKGLFSCHFFSQFAPTRGNLPTRQCYMPQRRLWRNLCAGVATRTPNQLYLPSPERAAAPAQGFQWFRQLVVSSYSYSEQLPYSVIARGHYGQKQPRQPSHTTHQQSICKTHDPTSQKKGKSQWT